MDMMEELLTAKEVARLLKVTDYQVYRWAKEGVLPVVRVWRKFTRFPKSGLEDFIAKHQTKGGSHVERQ